MHFCFRKRIHHQMECAAVDGRGGAVHSHGALHAPVRTADGELRRPSQKKNHRRAEEGIIDDTRRTPVSKIYRRVSFAGERAFCGAASGAWIMGALMDRKCACERVTGNWFTTDRH